MCPATTAPASASQSSCRPVPPPRRRPDDQRRIGDPRADHDVGAGIERGGDAPATEIRVGRDRVGGERLAGVEVRQLRPEAVDPWHQIIAVDVGDADPNAQPIGDLANPLGASGRVEPARIADDPYPTLGAGAEHLLHLRQERRRVPEFAVAGPLLVQDQHGQFGQPVAGQHIDVAALDHFLRCRQTIAEEPAAVGDADGTIVVHADSILTSGWPESTCWPARTKTSATVPPVGDTTWCSIFIASIVSNA